MRHVHPLLLLSLLLTLGAGCAGDTGETGPTGPQGDRGPPGIQGDAGVPCSGCVDAASLAPGAVEDTAVAASGITTRTKLPATLAYEDEPNVFTSLQTVSADLRVAGGATVGADAAPAATLDVRGELVHQGVHQVDAGPPAPYTISALRYVVDATPGKVGQVVRLDVARVNALCADEDGCEILVQMRDFNLPASRAVSSRRSHLIVAPDGNWRTSDDVWGVDGNAATNDWGVWDCYFTDAENMTNTSNGRADTLPGFGLLNVLGGSYSDTTTVCRVVLTD